MSKKVSRPDLNKVYENILIVPDFHGLAAHPDLIPFLKDQQEALKPDLTVFLGDILDGHQLSFHDKEDAMPSAVDELEQSLAVLHQVYKIFPAALLTWGNHERRQFRKAKQAGIPELYLRPEEEILQLPAGWSVAERFYINTPRGEVMFVHDLGGNPLSSAQKLATSVVSGHRHSSFQINYWSTKHALHFNMVAGCLINPHHPAFLYNKSQILRPILGCGAIIEGVPMLIPMTLNKNGRYDE